VQASRSFQSLDVANAPPLLWGLGSLTNIPVHLELDHFFVLTEPGAPLADKLIAGGLREGEPNTHPGQGTSNRRFFFTNSMLELLWLYDRAEAISGPGKRMRIAERAASVDASPFGLVFRPTEETNSKMPFAGWKYEPDYLGAPKFLHVGANSENLVEPLLIFIPFLAASVTHSAAADNGTVNSLRISAPLDESSIELSAAAGARDVSFELGAPHLLEVYCDGAKSGSIDLRPSLPLVVYR